MGRRLANRVVLITGGARGFGAATARAVGREGARVAVLDRDDDALKAFIVEMHGEGIEAMPLLADLANRNQLRSSVDQTVREFGHLDVLVNNGGIVGYGALESYPPEDWDTMLSVNVTSAVVLSQAAFPHMTQRGGGVIINIGSVASTMGNPNVSAYTMSKAALVSLTQLTAVEWGPRKIRCNIISPGFSTWPMAGRSTVNEIDEQHIVPLRRLLQPEDIANAVVFLASDEAACISGVNLVIDGAYSLSTQVLRRNYKQIVKPAER